MSSRIRITRSTGTHDENIARLKAALAEADAVVIGAGAGLSTSAGFVYSGERFEKYFADFEELYGFHDMYTGGFHVMQLAPEVTWAYWSRMIYINRYMNLPKPVYEKLFELVKDKDYFVLTTNVDHCFQRAGFDKKRLFYTQGDYGLWQCSKPCHQKTYDNEETVREMLLAQGFAFGEDGTLEVPEDGSLRVQVDGSLEMPADGQLKMPAGGQLNTSAGGQLKMEVPSELIPRCPVCGEPMSMNLRSDATFVEDEGWHQAAARYDNFLRTRAGKMLFLELGVGYNTPGIIKYSFWQMTDRDPDATYVCINYGEASCPEQISKRSICLDGDIGEILDELG
ncbi:MAG: Sir2 silent information regulator family NAD-dependent deacetylase [Firmicutes bacterium]|nr:Sir2 silent information regulator family NAD-dependent deacetylase [Bacillota bacterium]